MLHLLPLRWIVAVIAAFAGVAVLTAVYAGFIGVGDARGDALTVVRWAFGGAALLALPPLLVWRWIPAVQTMIFPYLGGCWRGHLEFSGPYGMGTREVRLEVTHNLLRLKLVLNTAESTSRTLAAHPERDHGIDRDRLYYVFLTERKEGVPGAGERYRGLAILRVEPGMPLELTGDYFTDTQQTGRLALRREQKHPWWAFCK